MENALHVRCENCPCGCYGEILESAPAADVVDFIKGILETFAFKQYFVKLLTSFKKKEHLKRELRHATLRSTITDLQ